MMTSAAVRDLAIKVPAATFAFWLIKILATTFGEVGGNLVSMDMGLGYLAATAILALVFLGFAVVQIRTRHFHPAVYWATIVASTTAGTTLADYVTRSLGIGYSGGSLLLFGLVIASLFAWRGAVGTVSADNVAGRRTETFYWITITFSQTLGTALGDWFADTAGLGYSGSAVVFSAILLLILMLHIWRKVDGVLLFWAAFILTRPLGAVVGNIFDKPVSHGGFEMSRPMITLTLAVMMIVAMVVFPQRTRTMVAGVRTEPDAPIATGHAL